MKHNKGFTLIELMVAISIIVVLSGIVMVALSSGKDKGNDSKTLSHIKSMINQAQLYSGTLAAVSSGTTAVAIPLTQASNMFADAASLTNNNLAKLINGLPTGTVVYYAAEAVSPVSGGKWAIAASTSKGSICVDYTTIVRTQTTTVMTTAASPAASSGPILYPNLASSFTCN